MTQPVLALKVDVDTWVGTREGVPRLVELLDSKNAPATFFFSVGPDCSGRALTRLFKRPGFLKKMLRTRAPSAYGLKTLFMGTLLPAPIIGQGHEDLIRSLCGTVHEVGLHAWDHVFWHDKLWALPDEDVRKELKRGLDFLVGCTGRLPLGFAAPAWRMNRAAFEYLEAVGLAYVSGTRGRTPYFPSVEGRRFDVLEIPTTLPTADEILGVDGLRPQGLPDFYLERIREPGLHVLTIHAEMEGRGLAPAFSRLLDLCADQGIRMVRLIDLAREALADPERIPVSEIVRLELPGRPGRVSHQAP